MSDYERLRAKKIARNKALLKELHLDKPNQSLNSNNNKNQSNKQDDDEETKERVPFKKRKRGSGLTTTTETRALRSSARIASASTKQTYKEDDEEEKTPSKTDKTSNGTARDNKSIKLANASLAKVPKTRNPEEISELQKKWTSWTPAAKPPTREENGTFIFPSHPGFQPNKSPCEVLQEGCFGGSYFRPLYSAALGITIADDWKELPEAWIRGMNVESQMIGTVYDAQINKFGVACGQSIEEWEANGWINHEYDVRGWFQWYCRFFIGRRCDDDERQISRWKKCVGERGRWRRILLKKYVAAGIRSVTDDGDDEIEGVSPAIHQTCHHWSWEVRQDVLDRWWAGEHD